ncbi:MAG: helicase-related protein, partial [Planctomycetota bacterium]
GERQRALEQFKDGKTSVLVASDVAARGLDVDEISHVIKYELPTDAETYVHRIGRTGRAGAKGRAVSFCGLEERVHLDSIERFIQKDLNEIEEHPYASPVPRKMNKSSNVTAGANRGRAGAGRKSPWRKIGRRRPTRRRR